MQYDNDIAKRDKVNISYDYYKVFYYIAKYGNITKAAKLLINNQPNLTRIIKNLENSLGCPLFTRNNRGMKLTPEGGKLYRHISAAFEHIEAAEEEISESRSLNGGSVYIAASEVALRCLLLPVLKKYRTLYPNIHIRVSNHTTPQAVAALKDGAADIAVVTAPAAGSPSLTAKKVGSVNEVAVCSPFFSGLLGKKVSLAELVKFPLISLGSDTMSFSFYSGLFADYGLAFKPDIEAFTADQILPLVEADLGIGFVPKEFVKCSNNAAIIDLKETIPERSIAVIKRKDKPLSIAAKELERMICGL